MYDWFRYRCLKICKGNVALRNCSRSGANTTLEIIKWWHIHWEYNFLQQNFLNTKYQNFLHPWHGYQTWSQWTLNTLYLIIARENKGIIFVINIILRHSNPLHLTQGHCFLMFPGKSPPPLLMHLRCCNVRGHRWKKLLSKLIPNEQHK